MTSTHATRPRSANTRVEKSRSAIYPVNGGFLFVPSEDMWNVHDSSKPSAILSRAGLARVDWFQWARKHQGSHPWLSEWLYSACPPHADAGDFQPTPAMLAFRKEAKIKAILAAATRPPERMQKAWRADYRPHVTTALLSYWRRSYKQFDWFDRWLLRGEEPPVEVTVATAIQARRCALAWDYPTFCQRIGVRSDSTYVLWLSRRLIPNLDWLKWLFGAPPPSGSFVVGEELQGLRSEMGRKGILRAAKLNSATIWVWEHGALTKAPIEAILAGGNGKDADEWNQLCPGTRQHMEDVQKARSLEACCARAGLSVPRYYTELKEAERCGVKGELLQYLKIEGRYTAAKSAQSGLVADNFFIPTELMVKFRTEAKRAGTEQQVSALQNLPGFDNWFLDWTTPKPHRGRRHLVPANATAPPQGKPALEQGSQERASVPSQTTSEVQAGGRATYVKTHKRRGRPKGSADPEVKARNEQIVRDHLAKKYPSIAALGEAYDLDRSRVSRILKEAGA